ncbi:Extracellular matrix protein FRAS1 [Hypsizygus marmoreus]|uniref:Extracellular matrix protein FRAS1 n=1 Tax=Hypsizygus marmoreus TaxID=39966 RepID=A0A369JIX8_HYPMA|nr:Extracellular matrix protein FRAS1 [Hypsizygus marmoreus]
MFASFLAIPIALVVSVFAQSSPSVVCVAGQCLQGFSNTTIGAKLSAAGAPTSIHLLPGQYTATTNPQLLHELLTSQFTSYTPSAGFTNATSSTALPLNLALEPGLAIYAQRLYSGQAGFSQLPSAPATANSSTPLTASSLAMSSNVWVAVSTGSNDRVVLWDAIPDVAQLPTGTSTSLSLLDMQSSACSPACSGSGVCSASGTCTCPSGFTGASCETCASGFFGPTCQACPAGCTSCDEGISGSGRCLTPVVPNAPSTCNCLNGECGSNGQCACNSGWTTADNGTACAKCSPGFFLTSTGDCQVCQLGCTQCADTTGACIACKQGFTQDPNDKTRCNTLPSTTTTGTPCPEGSFSNEATCSLCSPSCKTCTGPTSNDCVICAAGQYLFNGNCVGTNSDGVCEGSNLIADNIKHECDSCGAKCTSCKIPGFSAASTVNQLQCTGCLPGFVLSDGKCVETCPTGTFVSSQDNLTCIPCDSSCGTCSGAANFCLTCAGNELASNGKCVSACPSGTFSTPGSCVTCHPDCATCSGTSFNQCSSCPPDRPVLTNGRCLPTCSRSQYFDKTSGSCQTCDSSCSSCSGPGPSSCLACSSASQVLRGGSCVQANCAGSSNVIAGLGVCLSELVQVPTVTESGSPALPSITGLTNPTVTNAPRRTLEWWQILLMALGCAFIFLMFLMCWRRRARKQRAKRTALFVSVKKLDTKLSWRGRFVRFGERFFGHRRTQPILLPTHTNATEEMRLRKLREAEEMDLDQFINAYDYSKAESRYSQAPSALPPLDSKARRNNHLNGLSGHSLYSEVTGRPRQMPEPRQPIRKDLLSSSRYSSSTLSSSLSIRTRELVPAPAPPTDAEAYARAIRPALAASPPLNPGTAWIKPTTTGGSSRNPFRR